MAALATWWMQSPESQQQFVEYLAKVYAGDAEPATLATLSGKTYVALDAEFREFLEQLPE
jgi:hypothetical protein